MLAANQIAELCRAPRRDGHIGSGSNSNELTLSISIGSHPDSRSNIVGRGVQSGNGKLNVTSC